MPSTSATATMAAPDGQAGSTNQPQSTGNCPLQPLGGLNEPPQTPLSTASVSQSHWAPTGAEAGGIVCSPASWAVACRCSASWCRKGAGPTAPWDGPSLWAAGTSASRGVALLFKACPLLSGVSAYAADPGGSFTAAQGNLSGSHVTMVSMYAPVERQEHFLAAKPPLCYANRHSLIPRG